MDNQFDITFGKLPTTFIGRMDTIAEIENDFCSDFPLSNVYIISGVRGCGKTVLLNKIYSIFSEKEEWVVVKINPNRDILEQIAASIYENENVKKLFVKKNISFSFHGISFSIEGEVPVSNAKTLLDKMFSHLKKHGKKILLCLDEASNSPEMRAFALDFQNFIGDNQPLFLLMTGLYENINSLQNKKSLTFLYRAPKIYLQPLDLIDIKDAYLKIFKSTAFEDILELAKLTCGYAYAFQLVGSLFSKTQKISNGFIEELDSNLKGYCYDKVYEGIPNSELSLIKIIPESGSCSSRFIVDHSKFTIKEISVYKDRLIKRGVLRDQKGIFEFTLPRFANYLKKKENIIWYENYS